MTKTKFVIRKSDRLSDKVQLIHMEALNTLIVRRFKLLYIFAQQIESEHLLDQLEILAEQIKAGHPQVAEALDYYEDSIIQIFQ